MVAIRSPTLSCWHSATTASCLLWIRCSGRFLRGNDHRHQRLLSGQLIAFQQPLVHHLVLGP